MTDPPTHAARFPATRASISSRFLGALPSLFLVLSIFFLSLSLRVGIASIGPVLPSVLHDLHASLPFGSLLTTAPVLMMGLAAPGALVVATRWGVEWTIVLALGLICISILARIWTASEGTLLTTAIALGIGTAAGNTLLPAIVRSYFPARAALMTGVYTVGISGGAGVAAFGTPLVESKLGTSWHYALAVWSVVAFAASLMWVAIAVRIRVQPRSAGLAMPLRIPRAWIITLLFGLQAMIYFGALAWLAALYEEHGWTKTEAGFLLFLFTVMSVFGAILASVGIHRSGDLVSGIRAAAGVCTIGLVLVALTPVSAPWIWIVILGLGCGGLLPLALMLPLAATTSVDDARQWTTLMLCFGYLLAAAGPFVVSELRTFSGTFELAFLALAVVGVACLVMARWAVGTGSVSGRPKPIDEHP